MSMIGFRVFSFVRRAGKKMYQLMDGIPHSPVKVLERDGHWVRCQSNGIVWRLDDRQDVDNHVLNEGVFEPESTCWVHELVKPGMVVADVGANFGYYTMQLSRLVGADGRVYAFEPSSRFRARLEEHVKENRCENVTVEAFGLSDRTGSLQLYEGGDSATLHWCDERKAPIGTETIQLRPFDEFAEEIRLQRLDFIKVDIDGNEPRFVAGAVRALQKFQPILLMEFMQLALLQAGSNVEQLAEQLTALGYTLHSERTGKAFANRTEFLIEAMNCAYSVNVLCLPRGRVLTPVPR